MTIETLSTILILLLFICMKGVTGTIQPAICIEMEFVMLFEYFPTQNSYDDVDGQ